MFDTIVWATDGSPSADLALSYVKSLAISHDGKVVVVHCVETYPAHIAAGMAVSDNEALMRSKIERQVAELEREGFGVTFKVVTGYPGDRPAHAIADVARDLGADVIVAGTRGHTSIGGLVIGSVTHRLLHIAPCPVLIVPAAPRAADADSEAARAGAGAS